MYAPSASLRKRSTPDAKAVQQDADYACKLLADAWKVLADDQVPAATKRQMLGTIVQRVECGKEGAKVYFVPGLFGETYTAENGDEATDSDASRLTFHTTCVVCDVKRDQRRYSVEGPAQYDTAI